MKQQRYEELSTVLTDSIFRYVWCEAEYCACMGCVNRAEQKRFHKAAIVPPTKEEWLEWALSETNKEMHVLINLLERFAELRQQPPTIKNYREWLALSEEGRKEIYLIRKLIRERY